MCWLQPAVPIFNQSSPSAFKPAVYYSSWHFPARIFWRYFWITVQKFRHMLHKTHFQHDPFFLAFFFSVWPWMFILSNCTPLFVFCDGKALSFFFNIWALFVCIRGKFKVYLNFSIDGSNFRFIHSFIIINSISKLDAIQDGFFAFPDFARPPDSSISIHILCLIIVVFCSKNM
jgi:hypothetical protein